MSNLSPLQHPPPFAMMGGGELGVARGRGRGGRGRGRGRGFNNGGGYGQPGDDPTFPAVLVFKGVGNERVFLPQVALDPMVTGTVVPTLATVSISSAFSVCPGVRWSSPGNLSLFLFFCYCEKRFYISLLEATGLNVIFD